MSSKQNSNTSSNNETYTNPAFPNLIFKKVDGKDVVVGVKDDSINRKVKSKITTIKTKIN